MQKIKNALHLNKDHPTTTNNSAYTAGTSNTYVAPGTSNVAYDSLDKNKDGRVDAADFSGRGTSTTHHNPLDRNHDGKINLKDLKPSAGREAPINDAKLASLDRNHDGRVDARDFQGQPSSLSSGLMMGQQQQPFNTLDRNHDGRVDALDFQGQSSSLATVRSAPTHVEVIEKNVVVHEHIHPVEKEEIQPIIHREREQLDIHQVTQQLHETKIQPTIVQQRELAAEIRAPIVERGAPIQENIVLPSVDRDATMRSVQVHAPIVEETIKKTVIEEVQPVLERDVFIPTIVQQTQPIYEKVVEAPHVYRETLPVRELGTSSRNTEFIQAPIVQQPVLVQQQPIVVQREAPIAQPRMVEPVTMTTTTTTTDSFVPAKLVKDGELRSFNSTGAPVERRVL